MLTSSPKITHLSRPAAGGRRPAAAAPPSAAHRARCSGGRRCWGWTLLPAAAVSAAQAQRGTPGGLRAEQGVWAAGAAAAAAPTPHVGPEAAPTSCIALHLTPAAAEGRRKWRACQRARRLLAARRGSARGLHGTAFHHTASGLKAPGRSIATTGVLISNPRGRLGQRRASSQQAAAPSDHTNRGADGSRPARSLTA